MNTETDTIKKQTEEVFGKVISAGNFSEEQKQELFMKLEEAIVLYSINQLLKNIPEGNKDLAGSMQFGSQEEYLQYLKEKTDPQHFSEAISSAAGKVATKFFDSFFGNMPQVS